jgi:hypothetical protein
MNRILSITLALLLIAGSAFAACTQAFPTSAKQEFLTGTHDSADIYKIAFFTDTATWGAATTAYAATNEVTGTGYTAGGFAVVPTAGAATTTGIIDFADIAPTTVTFAAASTCAMIYNTSKTNKILGVFTFTSVQPSAGTLTVDFPASGASTSTIRIADIWNWLLPSAYADEYVTRRDAQVEIIGVSALAEAAGFR